MGISSFEGGFMNGVTIRGIPVQMTNPGKVFWVNGSSVLAEGAKSGSNGNKGTYREPFATIDYAIGKCTAGRGDIIMVMPGHTETVTTDGGIACDVAGVAIIGLGTGTARPQIILDSAAAAAVTVSAANVTLHNLLFVASFADITNAIDVTAAELTVSSCEFQEEAADLNFVDIINASSTTNNTAHGLTVVNCKSTGIDAGIDSFIVTAADLARLTVKDNFVWHFGTGALHLVEALTGKDLVAAEITGNVYASAITASFVGISADTTTANTGVIADNYFTSRDTAGELIVTASTNFSPYNNLTTSVGGASGYALPAADS